MPVAVVTDSTACLPDEFIDVYDLTVVPLTVAVDGVEGAEGRQVRSVDVARALSVKRVPVTTSRPAPAQFARAYRRLLDSGASGVVSVHLSGRLSGTAESATLAASDFDGRVVVVDSRSIGMGLGFAVLAAGAAAAAGGDLSRVRASAAGTIARTKTFFYVDTLEFLRRSGRVSVASALFGTVLSVRPILYVHDGEIVPSDKVRTASRALARLADLAVEAYGDSEVDVAVHHLGQPDRATGLLDALAGRLGHRLHDRYVTETDAVVAAHAGPGVVGVVVHQRPVPG